MPKDSGSWFKMPDLGGSKTQVLDGDAPQVALPSADFAADAVYVQDGMDLRMTGPDGQVVIIRGYFDGNPPALTTPEGGQLSPSLVRSFVMPEHAGEYAGPMGDAPAIGEVYKMEGEAWVTHADGTKEPLELGAPIFQGDVIETSADGAVNILFDDETRFAVSKDARFSIDEFNFTPGQGGESNFSMLKGVFVYTSGLIGKEDPDDVEINTPVGSIGIRGTIVGGVIDSTGSEITVIEGSITFTNGGGTVVLDESNETLVASDFDTTATNVGTMDSNQMQTTYSSLSGVADGMYSAITTQDANGQTEGTTGEPTAETAPEGDGTQPAPDANTAPDGSEPPPPTGSEPPPPDGSEPPPPDADQTLQPPPDGDPMLADGTEPPPPDGSEPPPPDGSLDPALADGTNDPTLDGSGDVLINEQPVGTEPVLTNDSTVTTADGGTTAPPPNGGTTTTTTAPPPPPPPPADGGTTGTTAPPPPPPNLLPNVTGTFPAAGFERSGTSFSYDFSNLFTDPEGSQVDVSVQSPIPGFMTYDPVAQVLTGTPSDLDFGIYQVVVRGHDDQGAFRDVAFTFTVADNDGDIDMTGVFSGRNGFGLIGDSTSNAGDYLGADVSGIGDINHDGYADVMVGQPGGEAAYVIFGGPQGIPRNFDVNTLNGTNGFSITGITGALGLTVTGLGDIDGDGLDDYAIGAPEATSLSANSGGAFILYGEFIGPGGTMFGSNLNLGTDLAAFSTTGFGFSAGDYDNTASFADQGGFEIAGIGDVNNDGYADFIITAPGADAAIADSGVARLVLGGEYLNSANIGSTLQPGTDTLPNLPDLNAETGTAFYGSQAYGMFGTAASGGDHDGDGINDFAIGEVGTDTVYLVYGQAGTLNGSNIIDLQNSGDIDGNNIVVIQGIAGTNFGAAVALDGDLNGDGFNDLVVGADFDSSGNGAVFIFNGVNGGFAGGTANTLSVAASDHDHRISGGTGENFGYSVSYAGDVNGDGYDDLIVGSDNGGQASVSILWGSASGINLTSTDFATQNDGMHLLTTAYNGLGASVSAAGDINGDGFDDLIVGAPNTGAANEGGSTIIYGGNYTGAVTQTGSSGNDYNLQAINGAGQDVIVSGAGDDSIMGDGGMDVYRMGAGNDKVAISDANYLEIDGGSGEDELYLNGAFTLDLSIDGRQNRIEGIEIFNMDNGLTNTLRLGLEDILQSDINEIVILGDNNDTFEADFSSMNFTQVGHDQSMVNEGTFGNFDVFSNGSVTILVDTNIGTANVTL